MVASVPTRMGWGAFGVVSALISTVGLGAMVEPAFSQLQQQACVETNAGQVVCGRLVDNNNNRNNRNNRDRNNDRYDDDRSNSNACSINGFDEQFYRLAYQDVEAAIRQGRVKTACSHYRSFGRYEGRFPRFNEASYLTKNPDVANAIRLKQFRSAYEHWQKYGRFENRSL
ncbi:MAG: hypothetical protein LH647_20325 [Leptolyngbyaceae cyanobacterium CAN_BIN12]|nr:hypothetical protein [Leptolyngbyaceae cyanobacterium CAN_BIN12]